jgi:hypothetical protein
MNIFMYVIIYMYIKIKILDKYMIISTFSYQLEHDQAIQFVHM